MFFQSRCNTFVTFVYFYIRLFGKKLEKSCLTKRLKCEQKCAKKGLCAICIVGYLEGYRRISERYAAEYWWPTACICATTQNNSGCEAIIRCSWSGQQAPACSALSTTEPQAAHVPWCKTTPIIYRRNPDCGHSRMDRGKVCRHPPRQCPIIYR